MPNLEWDVRHTITSPLGSLDLNTVDPTTGRVYLVRPDDYKIVPTMRVTQDAISQQDGSVIHPRYTTGLTATLSVVYAVCPDLSLPDYKAACGADLREMHEALMLHIHALLKPNTVGDPNTTQRLIWYPAGLGDSRLIQAIQTTGWAEPGHDGIETYCAFSFEAPYPYAIDSTPNAPVTATDGGGSTLIPNAGDTPFYAVLQVAGPTTLFGITNIDDPTITIEFDSSRPGGVAVGGGGAPIVTFDGTFYQGGAGADLIAGFDPVATEFFPIQPGGTHIAATGADVTVTTNNAYC